LNSRDTRIVLALIASAACVRAHAQEIPAAIGPEPVRPFRTYAVGLRIGTAGIGGELATPLSRHLDLRGGGQFFKYSTSFTTNGLNADGQLSLQNGYVSLDYLPFHNGFRISPGITVHNDNHVSAVLNVPGGNTFTLGDVDYTSEASDPIHGTASINFGNTVAPRITAGWGSLFPSTGRRLSFPAEIGFEYTSYPTVQLNLAGSGCTSDGCGSINTPDNQANINAEIQKLNNDVAPLRFYPILSFGVSYRLNR
jgi:hypothetical protein